MTLHYNIGRAVDLMVHSPLHADWTISDIHHRLIPPILLGQVCFLTRNEDGFDVGFATYAWANDDLHRRLLDPNYSMMRDDWDFPGDNLWLLNVVAPWGHASKITRALRDHQINAGHAGKYVYFRRINGTRKRYSKAML